MIRKKKIVCIRKNAEINCLPQRCIWKKLVRRDHLRYAGFGGFLKKLSAQPEWRKKRASAQSMVEKNFLPPKNHDTPPRGGGNNMLLLTELEVHTRKYLF